VDSVLVGEHCLALTALGAGSDLLYLLGVEASAARKHAGPECSMRNRIARILFGCSPS
jgi:hypothetical protein